MCVLMNRVRSACHKPSVVTSTQNAYNKKCQELCSIPIQICAELLPLKYLCVLFSFTEMSHHSDNYSQVKEFFISLYLKKFFQKLHLSYLINQIHSTTSQLFLIYFACNTAPLYNYNNY